MPVDRPPRAGSLDRDELNALREISKGLIRQSISAEHREKLMQLGYVQEGLLGKIKITLAGKTLLGK